MPTETRHLEIENGVVRQVRRIVEREVAESEFAKALALCAPVSTGVMPPGAFLVISEDKFRVMAYQVAPKEYNLRWRPNSIVYNCIVRLPWMQWYGIFKADRLVSVGISCSTEQIMHGETQVRLPPLPNIYTGQNVVCMGNLALSTATQPWLRIQKTVDNILGSEWNNDLVPDWGELGLVDDDAWQKAREANSHSGVDQSFGLYQLAKLSQMKDDYWKQATNRHPALRMPTDAHGTDLNTVDKLVERFLTLYSEER